VDSTGSIEAETPLAATLKPNDLFEWELVEGAIDVRVEGLSPNIVARSPAEFVLQQPALLETADQAPRTVTYTTQLIRDLPVDVRRPGKPTQPPVDLVDPTKEPTVREDLGHLPGAKDPPPSPLFLLDILA
jgi:hypothetical protein